ncbi:hypothetical protein [Paracoccus aerodenitrificans]|uniref:hypothetical protein n=1 Tax=Paracoccus aerodenitrificans TaxID=3017781 RepID=UPI0022F072D8|nr:hypothetical protein [Paracoccus aerodenitrificans]WBU62889.1 hypothetical protein PAE61_10970 [Paracoccus aerodenitrificans]
MRRRVFYIPGYDPIPPRRYRELFRREGASQAAISGYRLDTGPRTDSTGFGWGASVEKDSQQSEAEFEVLVWADIVAGSMGQSIAATYGQLARTAWAYIGSGALWRLMRLRRGPVIAALYPVVVLLAQALAAGLAGWLAGWLVSVVATWFLGLPVALIVFVLGLRLWRRLDGRIFAYYLMHDYAFTAQNGGEYPPSLQQRIGDFADRITEAADADWDEVLVVGHSSGAYIAVSVLAGLARDGRLSGKIALLSLGHVVPMAAFLPRADQLRRDLHDLAARDICWVDVTAPGDACSFGLCDPVAVSRCVPEGGGGPLILSAAFRQTLSAGKQKELRGRWFRLHFQYLCAFDRPGNYDYFLITAGPRTLAERFAGRKHSPGRIAVPANRWHYP